MSFKSIAKTTALMIVPMVAGFAQELPDAAPTSTFNWAQARLEAPTVKLPEAQSVVVAPTAAKRELFPRKVDFYAELAADLLLVADWGQTLSMTDKWYDNGQGKKREVNPLLGTAPSRAKVNRYFGAVILGKAALLAFADADTRLALNTGCIVLEVACVSGNIGVGARVKF